MKYFILSIDDGTVYDAKTVAILNRLNLKATFNLNSGLDDYVWYNQGRPIRRLRLKENAFLYKGHEKASHTLTHPYLDSCPDEEIVRQVNEDITNLESIFGEEIVSFATPFETCGDRECQIIKTKTKIKDIRVSKIDESFAMPIDPYFIPCTCFEIDRALELFPSFLGKEGDALFVYAGHSYDFELGKSWDKLEKLLLQVLDNGVKTITMKELLSLIKRN
ncbi:MAG: polysaccharide deacetylase family protein [Bacilli bacterium]|nr:polysaccharide deacetylase family protein [Bacilli bacterium]